MISDESGVTSSDMGELDVSFGIPDGLLIHVRWNHGDPASCSSASDASWGGLQLYVQKTLIWGEPFGSDHHRLEWDWVGFLRHLTVAWPRLTQKQDYPSVFNFERLQVPEHPGQFRACVERYWRENFVRSSNPHKHKEEEALFDFLHFHDLASGLPGTGVDSLVLLRQGDSLLVGSKNQKWLLDERQCMKTLEAFGNQIALRVQHIQDLRLQDLLERWRNRNQLAPKLKWELAANDDDCSMLKDALSSDGSLNETHWPSLAVAARMVGNTMSKEQKSHLLQRIRSLNVLTRGRNAKLEKLRKAIPQEILHLPTPRERGMELARWLRRKKGMKDHQSRVEPDAILSAWNVAVLNMTSKAVLDAVAVWGRGLQPTIFVNTKGVRASKDTGKRFTLAHEMAHLLTDTDRDGDVLGGREIPDRDMETQANAFAAEFILPENEVRIVLNKSGQSITCKMIEEVLNQLNERFGASHELASWKLMHTGLISKEFEEQCLHGNLNSINHPY